MPSFDIVSNLDQQEVVNALDQANREIKNRFDFKGTNANFKLNEQKIMLLAPTAFQLQQMQQILQAKLVKRGITLDSLEYGKISETLHEAKQEVTLNCGIDQEIGKKIIKLIKEANLKVQTALLGDHVRVTGKKRDDLQMVIALLKKEPLKIPLQFENFKD